jgi:predicted amidohydrolase
MRIAAAQMDLAWEDRSANHDKAYGLAKQAREEGAELFILPEMFPTAFSLDTTITAESMDGPTPVLLRAIAKEFNLYVVGGFILKSNMGGQQNVALVVDPSGDDRARYAKIHPIKLLDEHTVHDPGTTPVMFELGDFGASCFICYDLRFPEIFRAVADESALIMVIASWPASRQKHWDLLLKARALENQCFVVGVNRVGQGGGLDFTGGSAVIDPYGEVRAHAGESEKLLVSDVALAEVAKIREELPFLKDRKTHVIL